MTRRPQTTRKAYRLLRILELLQSKPRTTRELARHFGVPARTVQRDLQTLREAGEPITALARGRYAMPIPHARGDDLHHGGAVA